MKKAVITTYLPATDTLGSRFRAQCEKTHVTIPRDYNLDYEECHRKALDKFMSIYRWLPEGHTVVAAELPRGKIAWVPCKKEGEK